ncbi:MAG: hypothetical protein KBA51_03225 [Kiritimatiellae bacterium]|nr:hypothetical protein [Kiritimatiellia bacterium]
MSVATVVVIQSLGGLVLLLSLTEHTLVTAVGYALVIGLPGNICICMLAGRGLDRMRPERWGLKTAGIAICVFIAVTALAFGSLFLPMPRQGRHLGNILAAYLWVAMAILTGIMAIAQIIGWAVGPKSSDLPTRH